MRSATLSMLGLGLALALSSPPAGAAVATAGATEPGVVKSDLLQEVRRGGGHFRGGRHFRGGFFRGRGFRSRGFYHARPYRRFWRHRHRRGFRIYAGPFWYGGYYSRCGWLRARALATGSPYWWRRYRICRRYY